MSIDVYEQIPVMESDKLLLREIEDADAEDLLKVYSDKAAVVLFNSDNCVNDFYYVSIEEMKDTIAFWKREYQSRYYVRWAIFDKMLIRQSVQ
ncbi:MAG: GNAT family N-acetyltransferase [Lachnospiraceae bacterium]